MSARRLVLIFAAAILVLSLSGCMKRYVFDFKKELSNSNSEGTWLVHGEEGNFTAAGLYLDQNAITCPFRFSGDFTMEVYFYLYIQGTEYMEWLEMYLIDTNDWNYSTWIGVGMHQTSPTNSEYWMGQRDDSPSLPGIIPGLDVEGNNIAIFEKRGNTVSIKINDEPVSVINISPSNQLAYYRPFLSAYDDDNVLGKGAYIQKVVVKYEDGNSAP